MRKVANSISYQNETKEKETFSLWEACYQELIEYKRLNGHCLVSSEDEANKLLSEWVIRQRQNFKNNVLPQERIDKLNKIGFVFDVRSYKWLEKYLLLCDYKNTHGHCLVLRREGILGEWVITQRRNFKKNLLSQEKIDKLNAIGFIWDKTEAQWHEMFIALDIYQKEYGTCHIPIFDEENIQLARWINTQRTNCRRKKLPQEKIDQLNSIGFIWNMLEHNWNDMYAWLCDYQKEYGDSLITTKEETYKELRIWTNVQRSNYKKNQLSQDCIDKLSQIGFIWSYRELQWEKMFQLLCEYKKIHGELFVPHDDKEYRRLYVWITNQRVSLKKGKLSQEKIDKLNAIGFVWKLRK